ncbi:MAG: (2Fe-2S)-binding protein [Candidatus Sulfomarinibacteraceae bacterium]
MYVCICKRVTDSQIHEAIGRGARKLEDLSRELGVATGCGQCACFAEDLLGDAPAPSGPNRALCEPVHSDA